KRRNRDLSRQRILEFLQLRFLRKSEIAFRPLKLFGKRLDPGQKSPAIQRTRQRDGGGDGMVRRTLWGTPARLAELHIRRCRLFRRWMLSQKIGDGKPRVRRFPQAGVG